MKHFCPCLKDLAFQSMSSCDLCLWQQYTACFNVQTLPAPCDSAPQAVNCSTGRHYCFYENLSGRHNEKELVSLKTGWSVCLCWMFVVKDTLLYIVCSLKKHKDTCNKDTEDSKTKSKWCFKNKRHLGSVCLISGGSLVFFQRFCVEIAGQTPTNTICHTSLYTRTPLLVILLFLQLCIFCLLYFSLSFPCKPCIKEHLYPSILSPLNTELPLNAAAINHVMECLVYCKNES